MDFPEHSGWTGMISEMELVPTDATGDLKNRSFYDMHFFCFTMTTCEE